MSTIRRSRPARQDRPWGCPQRRMVVGPRRVPTLVPGRGARDRESDPPPACLRHIPQFRPSVTLNYGFIGPQTSRWALHGLRHGTCLKASHLKGRPTWAPLDQDGNGLGTKRSRPVAGRFSRLRYGQVEVTLRSIQAEVPDDEYWRRQIKCPVRVPRQHRCARLRAGHR